MRGLRCRISADGVHWRSQPAESDEVALQPLCASDTGMHGEPELFVIGDEGLRSARMREGLVRLTAPFTPIAAAEPWYETLPDPDDIAVVWDEDANLYRAFFCSRRRRGRRQERLACIGVATSPDLREWETEPPVFAPNRFAAMWSPHPVMHEGKVILFYRTREQGDLQTLRFALAASFEGPYEIPDHDALSTDCRGAVRTADIGATTLVFFDRADPGDPRIRSVSRPGRLTLAPSGRPVIQFHSDLLSLADRPIMTTDAALDSAEPLVRVFPRHGADFCLSVNVRSLGASAAGVLCRTNITGSDNLIVWLDFERGGIQLRRGVKGRLLAEASHPLMERSNCRLMLWAEGPFLDVYLNDAWVLSGCTEARISGGFGVAVRGGEAHFEDLRVQSLTTSA